MNKFIKILYYFFLLLLTQNLSATQITYKVDDGKFLSKTFVYLEPSQKLTLKLDIKNLKAITWYLKNKDID